MNGSQKKKKKTNIIKNSFYFKQKQKYIPCYAQNLKKILDKIFIYYEK